MMFPSLASYFASEVFLSCDGEGWGCCREYGVVDD